MKILCTHPGRHGDVLWALASVRALAEAAGTPIDLATSPKYAGLVDLIAQQPYIGRAFALHDWAIEESAPITPRVPPAIPTGYDFVFHLGYRGWPAFSLPVETFQILWEQTAPQRPWWKPLALDLTRPWITASAGPPCDLAIGFSDEWFELKVGLVSLLDVQQPTEAGALLEAILAPSGSRWVREFGVHPTNWTAAAAVIASSRVFLGCNSALHVLACACGVPVVLMEPNAQRHHPIFYPYGKADPVTLVTGNDGQPTFDARHVQDALTQALAQGRRA